MCFHATFYRGCQIKPDTLLLRDAAFSFSLDGAKASVGAHLQQEVFIFQQQCYKFMEGFISSEIFIYFFINSDPNLTQTQMLPVKLSPNRILTKALT